jgi:peroxiredoxin
MSVSVALSIAALWILVILQGAILLGVVRVVHQLQQGGALASLPPQQGERLASQRVPEFTTVDVFGKPIGSADLTAPLTAVLFVSPKCSNCVVTLEELQLLQAKVDGNVVVVCMAETEECRHVVHDYDLTVPVIADPDQELSKRFDIISPPTAVLVSGGGHILQYGHPGRDENLEGLLRPEQEAATSGETR